LEEWEAIVGEIAAAESVREVILSGGDPLTLADEFLAWLAKRLAEIPQLTRLRVHTRFPIMVPQRVTDGLLAWLRGTRLATFVVVHVNHPAEIDEAVGEALTRLVQAGIPVLSQSVLLRGVNDRVDVLASLFERLADLRVMPYYLHQLDRVAGAAHFEVPEHEGIELVRQLRTRLPGYAVPRYVRQPPSGPSKLVLA
jgi:KamA family protein